MFEISVNKMHRLTGCPDGTRDLKPATRDLKPATRDGEIFNTLKTWLIKVFMASKEKLRQIPVLLCFTEEIKGNNLLIF